MSRRHLVFVFFGAVVLSFVLYGNSIPGEFVYDDHLWADRTELREPEHLLKLWTEPYLPAFPHAGIWRPFSVFTYALNFVVFGDSPVSFHVFSILLNGITTFLVFLLVCRLFSNMRLSFITAALFAVLPVHTEAVSFLKSREELLASVFTLLSWLAFLRGVQPIRRVAWGWLLVSSGLFVLAVLSKEFFVIVPLLFVLVSAMLGKLQRSRLFAFSVVFVPVTLVYLGVRYAILGSGGFGSDPDLYFIRDLLATTDPWTRFWTACSLATRYLTKILVPINLSATHHYAHVTLVDNPLRSLSALFGLVLLAVLVGVACWRRTRGTAVGVGAVAFLVPYFMISKFVFTGGETAADRFVYFSSLGIVLIVAAGLLWFMREQEEPWMAVVVLCALLAVYAPLVVFRNRVWLNSEALFQSMVIDAPRSVQGQLNLGKFYAERGNFERGKIYLENARRIYEDHAPLLEALAIVSFHEGKYEEARARADRAVELAPWRFEGYLMQALVLAKQERYEESLGIVETRLERAYDEPPVRFLLALDHFKLGHLEEARRYFDWNPSVSEREKIQYLEAF